MKLLKYLPNQIDTKLFESANKTRSQVPSWNYKARNNISFSFSKIFFVYLKVH